MLTGVSLTACSTTGAIDLLPAAAGGVDRGAEAVAEQADAPVAMKSFAVLLAQDLDNLPGSAGPLQVDHMPTTPTTTATASRPEAKVI